MAALSRRLSVRPSDVTGASQMKHPTTSRWNDVKTSQWYVSTTSYWSVVTTSQKDVTTTSHQHVSTTFQKSLKWNIQRRLCGMLPRRLSGTYPRCPISTSLRRLLQVPNKTLHLDHVSELLFHNVLLLGLYYSFKLLCHNLHLVDFYVSFKHQIKHQIFLVPNRRETKRVVWIIN